MDTNIQRTDDNSYVVFITLSVACDHPDVLRHIDVGKNLNTVKWLASGFSVETNVIMHTGN